MKTHLFYILLVFSFSITGLSVSAQEINKEAENYYLDLVKYVENMYAQYELYDTKLTNGEVDIAKEHLDNISMLGEDYSEQLIAKEAYLDDNSLLEAVTAYVDCFAKGSKKELLRVLNYNKNTYYTEEETKLANQASESFIEASTKIANHLNEVATLFHQTHVQISHEEFFCQGLKKMLERVDNGFEDIKGELARVSLMGKIHYTTELLPYTAQGTMLSSVGAYATFIFYSDPNETEAIQYFELLEGFVDFCFPDWTKKKESLPTSEWDSLDGSSVLYYEGDFIFDYIRVEGKEIEGYYQVSILMSG